MIKTKVDKEPQWGFNFFSYWNIGIKIKKKKKISGIGSAIICWHNGDSKYYQSRNCFNQLFKL